MVALLGPLVVRPDGAGSPATAIPGLRLRTLVARLALDAGRSVPSEALADALWGEDPPTDQSNALQSLVSRLRRALPHEAVASTGGGYRLDVAPRDVDALRFETLVRDGRARLAAGDAAAASATLVEALELWRGPALVDAGSQPFVLDAGARLEELRLSALEDRLDADLTLGRHMSVVGELEALATAFPLRERLSAALVRALYAAGRQAEAFAAYERTRALLADELGVDPGPQLRAAHAEVLRGEAPPAPGPAGRSARSNLRAQVTSFVGRADQVEHLRGMLQSNRLVTLVGPGGSGKTRLASEVGACLAPTMRHGVWLAELASVTDPDDLPAAVLGSLGLRETTLLDARRGAAPRDAVDRLVESLVDKETLIVLDNCEHLVEAAARLTDQLLARCPELRVLATSREPLAILGETIVPVPPLAQPDPSSTPATALEAPAVQLFVDRALAASPGFALDDSTVGAVSVICRRLDGLPLAIELAAARLRTMPADLVAARLDDRFRLLTGGSRAAVPRHRTLRAVVQWSWDLLTDDERRLAERVAAFPAGVTPASAEAVCAGVVAPGLVPDLLASLVDKSLLLLADGPRYRMLETIREYGVEQLVERAEIQDVRARHAAYFLELAERADPLLRTADQMRWLDELTAERDNLLAALRLAVDVGDAGTAVRLGAALGWFWTLRGLHAEASSWLSQVLAVPGDSPLEARLTAGTIYGMSALTSGEPQVGLDVLHGVADLGRESGFTGGGLMLGLAAAGVAMFENDYPAARLALDEAEARAGGDRWGVAALRMMRGFAAENAGDVPTMRRSLLEAQDIFAALGERWGMGTTMSALGGLRFTDGDLDGALDALERSLTMMRELGSQDDAAQVVVRIAMVRARQGDPDRARQELQQLLVEQTEQGSVIWSSFAAAALADLARVQGDRDQARTLIEQALADLDLVGSAPPQIRAICLVTLALLELSDDRTDGARDALREAYRAAVLAMDMPITAVVAGGATALAAHEGRPDLAVRLLGAVTALRGSEEVGNPEIDAMKARLRDELGMPRYDAGYAEGLALSSREALSLLRSSVDRP